MSKTLEEKLREKFATGYDPISIDVRMRANNAENLEVYIDGGLYSVKGNVVTSLGKEDQTPTDSAQKELFIGPALIGSGTQPNGWQLEDGTAIGLGLIVVEAHTRSGLTAEEWNALPDEDREQAIAAVVADLIPATAKAYGVPVQLDTGVASFDVRRDLILSFFEANKLRAVNEDTAQTYGDVVYEVVQYRNAVDGGDTVLVVVATGTLEELEAVIATSKENQNAAA